MPATRSYEVEQTRIINVTAESPTAAVIKAHQAFDEDAAGVPNDVRVTSINARESY